jgi:hypothetical protein
MIWPTIISLVSSIVILIFTGIILGASCCGQGVIDRMTNYEGYFNNIVSVIQTTIMTVAAGALFGSSADTNSLIYQTCSAGADAKQPFFPQINLGHICLQQVYVVHLLC